MDINEGIMHTRNGNYIDYLIVYGESPMDSTKKLLELVSELKKILGFKINIHKSVVFL